MPRASTQEQGNFFEPTTWQEMVSACAQIALDLGLDVETEVYVGRRIWGARRRIDRRGPVSAHPVIAYRRLSSSPQL